MISRHPFGVRHGITGLSPAVVAIVEALAGPEAPAAGTVRPAAPDAANRPDAKVLMHLAGPIVGAEIREIVRDLARVAGVARVRPGAKLPKLLLVDYDPTVVAAQSLVALARRRWTAAQLVGM
jgi:hypothetical protein